MKTLPKDYKEVYEEGAIIDQQTDDEEVNFFANLISHQKQLNILDLGCAEGKLAVLLALKGHNVTAADISQNFLNKASNLAKEKNVKVNTIWCDIEENVDNLKGKKFDVIYFMDVIEHLRNPIVALENIKNLLKDNGTLIIHTPNVCSLSRFLRYLRKRKEMINYYDPKNLWDLHLQLYDYLTLEKILNFIGLKVCEVIPTTLSVPKLGRFRFLSRLFPFLSDNLLVKCKKEEPIDVEKQISFWRKQFKI
jgi:2-polyprenyl-3-methyl-5-hydroxy-6-metoxy-1,4-benzoquinol methylase